MKIRLFINQRLDNLSHLTLGKEQSHYLFSVLRKKIGDEVFLFDNQTGEYSAIIFDSSAKISVLKIEKKISEYYPVPKIYLAFTPVKNVKSEYLVTKATELGVAGIKPIFTERSIIRKINEERLRKNIIEASEQCRRTDLPILESIRDLKDLLFEIGIGSNSEALLDRGGNSKPETNFDILFADESGQGKKASEVISSLDKKSKKLALIGPEGGFSELERQMIMRYSNVHAISLGPRILKADTAIITLISIIQNHIGDF